MSTCQSSNCACSWIAGDIWILILDRDAVPRDLKVSDRRYRQPKTRLSYSNVIGARQSCAGAVESCACSQEDTILLCFLRLF